VGWWRPTSCCTTMSTAPSPPITCSIPLAEDPV
jgi:hypothetical protein